jgi:hypothetical protein
MSIKADVRELENICFELKKLTIKRKQLNELKKNVENRIREYLKSKGQPGLKDNGKAIILDKKPVREKKKPKERDATSISVLEKFGVENPEKVLKELLDARKGEQIPGDKIKLIKYKLQ